VWGEQVDSLAIMFSRDLQPIKGRVIEVRRAKTFGGGSVGPLASQHEYIIEYQVEGAEPQRVVLKEKYGKMNSPGKGASVPLLLDRKSGKVTWDVNDPKLNLKAYLKAQEAAKKAAFNAKLND
jgi:hypothetical protein